MKPAIHYLSASRIIGVVILLIAFCLLLFAYPHPASAQTTDSCPVTDTNPPLTESLVNTPQINYTSHDGANCTPDGNSVDVTLDFSIFQSLFSQNIANYTEGQYQTSAHQTADLSQMAVSSPAKFNFFFGPSQKMFPQVGMDTLRLNYVEYVRDHPDLEEAKELFSDSQNKDSATISDLLQKYGIPKPPSLPGGEQGLTWTNHWGRYWEKIPTTTNNRAMGKLRFAFTVGCTNDGPFYNSYCDFNVKVPEIPRLSSVSNSLNLLMVPQGIQNGTPKLGSNESQNQMVAENKSSLLGVQTSQTSGGQVKGAFCPANLEGERGQAENFCSPNTEVGSCGGTDPYGNPLQTEATPPVECSQSGTNWTCTFHIPYKSATSCADCTQEGDHWNCPADINVLAEVPYLEQIWNRTTYSKENIPGFFDWFTPSLPNQDQVKTYASFEENKKPGQAENNANPNIQGINTIGGQVKASTDENKFFPKYIGGTNKFRSFTQFNALSPIPGGIGSEVYIPEAKPSTTPTPNPSPTPAPPGCDNIKYDGSVGDIQAYVWCSVNGNEPKTGRELRRVMTETMANESTGGKQCAVGSCAEIGVFQYIASTWQGSGFATNYTNSGSGTYGQRNSRTFCWNNTDSSDPQVILPDCNAAISNPDDFNWAKMFQGVGYDGGAWDPYLQTNATASLMGSGQACRWCGYVDYLIQTPPTGMTGVQYAQQLCPGSCTYLY